MATNAVWIAAIAGVVGTALGAISGALIGGWLNYRTEKRRWEREDKNRHHAERLRVYTEFYRTAGRISRKSWAELINEPPFDPEDVRESYSELRRMLGDLYTQVTMVASEPVREAAKRYMRAPDRHRHEHEELQELDQKMDEFVTAAREELGVSVGKRVVSS